MAITITTNLTTKDLDEIVQKLKDDTELTPRNKTSLKRNKVAVARDGNSMVGWLISEYLCKNVYEIGGAYINPSYRKKGIFSRLINELTSSNQTYVVATYEPYIVNHFCDNHKFKKSSLLSVALISKGKFITKRILSSLRVAQHLAKRRALYVVRLAEK